MTSLLNAVGSSSRHSLGLLAFLITFVAFVILFVGHAQAAEQRDFDIVRLIALDKKASSRIVSLSELRRSTWDLVSVELTSNADAQGTYKWAVSRLIDRNRQLLALEYQINGALEDAYIAASTDLTVDNRILLVQLAALHWHTQLRRHLQRRLHTSVPGLESDSRCAGDLLADQMLLDYLRAVWGDSTSSIQRIVESLDRIAAQSACLGSEQSDHFAQAANEAFADVEAFLRIQGMEWIIPSLAPLLAQPLVLFYDVEKYRGGDSPLARWFSKYQHVLVESVHHRRSPLKWHGLWLYDRTTGRLVGFADRARPKDENEIRLDHFFTSLTAPENLAAGDCSFKEMVQRGLGVSGYVCGGATCQIERDLQSAASDVLAGSPTAREAALSKLEILTAVGGLGRLPANAASQVCVSSREQSQGGGSALCNAASAGNALSPVAAALNCVGRQIMRPGTEVMSCVMEASGYCSDPVERLTKDLRSSDLYGVPLGKECGIGGDTDDTADGSQNTATRPLSPQTSNELNKATNDKNMAQVGVNKANDLLKAAEAAAKTAQSELDRATAAAAAARKELQKASQGNQGDVQKARDKLAAAESAAADATTKKNAADADVGIAKRIKDRADAAFEAAEKTWKKVNDKADLERALPVEQKLSPLIQATLEKSTDTKGSVGETTLTVTITKKTRGRCDPDNPDCDANKCTAMSESARKTMACVKKMTQDAPVPEFMAKGLGCDPRNCDPEETSATSTPRSSKCLELMDPGASQGLVMKQCGLVYCAGGGSALVTSQGTCDCGGAPASGAGANQGLVSQCSQLVYCESGAGEYGNGSCVCKEATMPNVIIGPGTPNLMKIGSPPSYMNNNPIPLPLKGTVGSPLP